MKFLYFLLLLLLSTFSVRRQIVGASQQQNKRKSLLNRGEKYLLNKHLHLKTFNELSIEHTCKASFWGHDALLEEKNSTL